MSWKTMVFKIEAEGHGCVNYFGTVGKKKSESNKNGQYNSPKFTKMIGASNFPNFENITTDFIESLGKIYISSQRVKKGIFSNLPMTDAFYTLLNGIPVESKERALWAFHPIFLLRGYLALSKSESEDENKSKEKESPSNIRMGKPAPMHVRDLVDTLGNYGVDVATRDKTSEEKKSNKLRQGIKVFDTAYTGEIHIDCEAMSWVSLSNLLRDSIIDLSVFDFNARKDEVLEFMRDSFKTLAIKIGHEVKGDLVSYNEGTESSDLKNDFSTAGIKLSSEAVMILLKTFLEGVREFSIKKNTGDVALSKIEVFASESKNILLGKKVKLNSETLEVE